MNTETMKTYVAEINGEAIIAFRAESDDHASAMVNEKDGGLQLGLNGFSGLRRADGSVLWNGETEIKARRATDAEHERLCKARDAEADGDADNFSIYLVPVKSIDEAEVDGAAV
jgi:hypothetical protein